MSDRTPEEQSTELVPVPREGPAMPALPVVRAADLYQALLADARCKNTREGRRHDAELLRKFLGAPTPAAACAAFISSGRGTANAIGLAWRAHELGRGLTPASVNRELATLRKLAVLARRFDIIEWAVDIEDIPNRAVPDRRGPGLDGWRALWAAAAAAGDGDRARMDRAILRLLHDSALRKGEVVALDLADVDFERPAVHVQGKGSAGVRSWVTINAPTVAALREWVEARGDWPGPLFTSVADPLGVAHGAFSAAARRVGALRAEGLRSLRAIADRLNAEGYVRHDGGDWDAERVGRC